jgi:predicted metal-dependent HD superfamily phosphohydrolase
MDFKGAIQHILNRLDTELPSHLSYHGHHHTVDVMEAVERIARHEDTSEENINLLLVAAAYHDAGFIYSHENHEEKGCEIVRSILPNYGFDQKTIEKVCQMIMATKVPQTPTGELSDMLCDADLDYLGRDDFTPISTSLFNELKYLGIVKDVETWNRIQVKFLRQHFYHTEYGKALRQPKKEIHLKKLEEIVAAYNS